MNEVDQIDAKNQSAKQSVHKFDAQCDKVLHLVINSLYSNKGVAIRELISNASDACEKLTYESVTNASLKWDGELRIVIKVDETQGTIAISDNGIGMSREEMIDNLGTIAKSGTESFVQSLAEAKNDKDKLDLIGHFGVGFYSSFMIADSVEVKSRRASSDECWHWVSDGKGEFTLMQLPDGELTRGTTIVLHVKDSEKEFLDKFKIENLVATYSDHIGFPIMYEDDKGELEQINEGSALWKKSPSEVDAEQHRKFFQGVSHMGGEPWLVMHNHNEGSLEYINLLYVPSIKPFDLFNPDRRTAVKLYMNKVFVNEGSIDLLPAYMRFIRGVIDSPDLPLNISRETLQGNNVAYKIRQSITAKVIKALKKRLEENPSDYDKVFWNNFGSVLKEGLCEFLPSNERERLFEICRFYSSREGGGLISLDDYLSKMPENQENIYYLNANSVDAALSSPQMEGFFERGIEVIFLLDPVVDNFWTSGNPDYKGKKFKSITRVGDDLDKFEKQGDRKDEPEIQQDEDKVQAVTDYIKKVLGDKVSAVRPSAKLVGSPSCLAVQEGAMDIRMERFMFEQKQIKSKSSKILEINMNHAVVAKLADNLDNACGEDIVKILFYQACVLEGETLEDPSVFRDAINRFVAA